MLRARFASLAVVLASLTVLSCAAPPARAAQTRRPHSEGACKHGGWRDLRDDEGRLFRNQGRCVAWQIHHRLGLADLTGVFDGTTEFTFQTGGCSFVHQSFDSAYGGSDAVGAVTLHIEGCVDLNSSVFTGSFTMTTNVGAVSGGVSGPVNIMLGTGPFADLTATVGAGTGSFVGMTGELRVVIEWAGFPSTDISGTVSLP